MKKSMMYFIFLSLFSFGGMNCTSQKKLQAADDKKILIFLSKEKTRGFSPSFSIKIFESGRVEFFGKKDVPVLGEKIFQLKKGTLEELKKEFEKSDFKKFEKTYLLNVMDIPKITFMFEGYTIVFQEKKAPTELKRLQELMEEFIPKE